MSFGGNREELLRCPHGHLVRGDRYAYHIVRCMPSRGNYSARDDGEPNHVRYLSKAEKQRRTAANLARFKDEHPEYKRADEQPFVWQLSASIDDSPATCNTVRCNMRTVGGERARLRADNDDAPPPPPTDKSKADASGQAALAVLGGGGDRPNAEEKSTAPTFLGGFGGIGRGNAHPNAY